jgi:hypothetical protein
MAKVRVYEQWPRILHGLNPLKSEGESLYGYLCRVAEANGYTGAQLLTLLRPDNASLFSPENFSRISFVLRIKEQLWASLVCGYEGPSEKGRYAFLGQEIPSSQMSIHLPRVCALCLRAQEVWWAVWDLRFVVACPLHQCELLDRCPKCRCPLDLARRVKVCLCRCGYDLRKHVPSEASNELIAVADSIYRASGFYRGLRGDNYCPISRFRYKLPVRLSELLSILVQLGAVKGERLPMLISGVSKVLLNAVRMGTIFSTTAYEQERWSPAWEQNAREYRQERPF